MIYSVWNQGIGAFDYFEDDSKPESLNTPAPRHIASRTLGSTIEQAAWPLPGNVRHIGSGAQAVGRVASRIGGRGGALGDILPSDPLIKAGLLVGVAALMWKFVVKAPRRSRA